MTILICEDNFGLVHRKLIEGVLRSGTVFGGGGKDVSAVIEVWRPWDPPVFSKCIWSDFEGAFDYVKEVVEGTMDVEVGKLGYTYHSRMSDQWPGMLTELRRNGVSRRVQCTTWRPEVDLGGAFVPCLQRIWLRVVEGKLDMHTHWRSRDALKAWGLNVFAFAHLHRMWAEEVKVEVGVYREFIDSCHIYGKDVRLASKLLVNRRDWQFSLVEMLRGRNDIT